MGSFLCFLKSDPLGESDANGVVDPPYFPSRDACGNYVVDDGIYGTKDFNLEAAAGLPRAAVAPAQFAVDVGEIVPAMQIGKNEPSERGACLGGNGILESCHNVFLTSPCRGDLFETSQPLGGGEEYLYVVSLTLSSI